MEPVRVMVVDDAADARYLIGLILDEADGIELVASTDGAEAALEQLDRTAPQLALVDARMPVTDGFALTGLLREQRPELKVALLTAMVDRVVSEHAQEAGADACWSKGDLEALPARVLELCAGDEAGPQGPRDLL